MWVLEELQICSTRDATVALQFRQCHAHFLFTIGGWGAGALLKLFVKGGPAPWIECALVVVSFLSDKWDERQFQSHYGLAEMSSEFCSIAGLNYVHQSCSLFNEQTFAVPSSICIAGSQYTSKIYHVFTIFFLSLEFQLDFVFSLTVPDILPFACLLL